MKRPGLNILVASVVLIGGYALYDYRQEHANPKSKEAANIMAVMTETQVQKFSIMSDKQTIELEKQNEIWRMIQPIQDQANQVSTDDFINGVLSEKSIEIAKEGESIDWSAYGLDKPKATITLFDKDGKSEIFRVGSGKNFEGNSFIKHDAINKVFVASSTWFAKSDKKVGDFRDQRLMRLPNSKIDKLIFEKDLNGKKTKFTLTKKESLWINLDQIKIRLDQNKIREILGMLNTTEALDFISEKPGTAAEMKMWDLVKPALRLTAKGEGKTWTGDFSSGKDRLYRVAVSDPQFVLKLSPVDSQKFLLADFDSFRDRHEPFQFDRNHVKILQIKIGEASKDLKNDGDEKVAEILKKIDGLQVHSYSDKPAQNLKNQIVLLGENNKQLLRLNWGESKKIEIAGTEALAVEAHSSLVDYGFMITEQEINALKLQDKK